MTSVWLHFVIQRGLQSIEARINAERQPEFWLSPEGRWFNVPSMEHEAFAGYIAKKLYNKDYTDFGYNTAGHFLIEQHWLMGRNQADRTKQKLPPRLCLTNCDGETDIDFTPEQYVALKEYYGNKAVFETWTIEMLWQKRRPKAKSQVRTIWLASKIAIEHDSPQLIGSVCKMASDYFEFTGQQALVHYVLCVAQTDDRSEWKNLEEILHLEYDIDECYDQKSKAFQLRQRIVEKWDELA